MYPERVAKIRDLLTAAFDPADLEVEDNSASHASHEGAKSGGGHFNVLIVSHVFRNQSLVQRHRMVFDAVGDMMKSDIHALSIKAYTPDEL